MPTKVFPAFDIEVGQHRLSPDQRAELKQEFNLAFTDQDFADMEAALDTCQGAYDALQNAPTTGGLQARLTHIAQAAQTLWDLLHPVGSTTEAADLNASSRAELSAAYEAANRVNLAFFPITGEHPDDHPDEEKRGQPYFDQGAFMRFAAFNEVLFQIPAVAATVAPSLAWAGISERGTAHIYYLREGLTKIAERHGQQKRFTRSDLNVDETGHKIKVEPRSFIASLTFCLGQFLPPGARPHSVEAVIAQMARDRSGPNNPSGSTSTK